MEKIEVKPAGADMTPAEREREAEFLKSQSPEELRELFKGYREGPNHKDLAMSDVEANRIDECMKKPEFASLFKEYIDDISNPGNMEEYDQYLRQLEAEGEIPDTEEVIRPDKGFCVKIATVDNGAKTFVNLCSTDRVPEPSQGDAKAGTNYDTTGSKGDGAFWSIPYIHTAVRMDRDKSDQPCHVYDILFSPEALKKGEQHPAFKALMIQTALESLEENGKIKLKNTEGKYDYSLLKNMTYKGQMVRPHKLKKELPVTDHDTKKKTTPSPATNKKPANKKPTPPKEPEDPTKPKMTFVHRGELDMSDALASSGSRELPISRRPKELVVRLELPLLESAGDMDLDIKGGFLEFTVPGVYNLKHKLPFPVDEGSGDAKYNKTLKVLTVTLTVQPWTKEEAEAELLLATEKFEALRLKTEEEDAARTAKEEADEKNVVKKGFLAGGGKSKGSKWTSPPRGWSRSRRAQGR